MKFEDYMLVVLGESAQEIIESVNEILQNGLHEIRRDSRNETNKHHLLVKYHELKAVMGKLFDDKILNDLDVDSKHSLRAFQRFRTDMEIERDYKVLPVAFLIIDRAVTIAHKASESLRFGIHAFQSRDPEYTNAIAIVSSYHQLCMIFDYAIYNGLLEELPEDEVRGVIDKKLAGDKTDIEKSVMIGTLTINS